jgi:endonuclease/exonuclease/phosphatase family metal-dependent hydrolase
MLKLITLNIEANKHYGRILPFLAKEKPDMVCLQEVPEDFQAALTDIGLEPAFLPLCKREVDGELLTLGICLAARVPYTYESHYYHKAGDHVALEVDAVKLASHSFGVMSATTKHNGYEYTISTTHFHPTKNGAADATQAFLLDALLTVLPAKPHVLCGDFNIPRGYNTLYPKLTDLYTDEIPREYQSSLDRDLHRCGKLPLTEPIFDAYMIDYIFTQAPYSASDVRLQFGVSDHAAVIAHIHTRS